MIDELHASREHLLDRPAVDLRRGCRQDHDPEAGAFPGAPVRHRWARVPARDDRGRRDQVSAVAHDALD